MIEEHVYDLIPGYALGCLDDEELIRVARHLPRCAACRKELEAYAVTAEGLAFAVPMIAPPADLRDQVIRRASQTAPVERIAPVARMTQTSAVESPMVEPKRSNFQAFFRSLVSTRLALVTGLAVVLLLLLGMNSIILTNRVNDLQAAATQAAQSEIRLVRLTGTENAPQAVGYLMIFKNENYGTLAVEHAAVLDPGQQYQIWLIRDGVRTSGGVFSVNEKGYGVIEIVSALPLEEYQSFGVTVEPAGGSPQPTGKKVIGGDL